MSLKSTKTSQIWSQEESSGGNHLKSGLQASQALIFISLSVFNFKAQRFWKGGVTWGIRTASYSCWEGLGLNGFTGKSQ